VHEEDKLRELNKQLQPFVDYPGKAGARAAAACLAIERHASTSTWWLRHGATLGLSLMASNLSYRQSEMAHFLVSDWEIYCRFHSLISVASPFPPPPPPELIW
jgi:hypothetical protein